MFGLSPNIKGKFGNLICRGTEAKAGTMGTAYEAFYVPGGSMGEINYIDDFSAAGQGQNNDSIGFDASRYSTVFNGTAMQTKALQALPCIRF